jgi:exosome complex RNA-binding protein Rrp4
VREFPIAFCRKLLEAEGQAFLEKLGEKFNFDINMGYNGKVWISTAKPHETIFLFQALYRLLEFGFSYENVDFIMNSIA